ncbi:MAG: phosphatidate cytidylyltransferase [Lactobacillaceae bacterium]|jgi:phosphatidate cytidylyltransferase|nr:phosphatidate cytidylyltransferase [Lactobacillaceae bacterium]
MKTRVITAIVALIVFIPTIVYGGWVLQILAALLAAIALSEVAMMRKRLLVSFEAIISMFGAMLMTLPNGIWKSIAEQLPIDLHATSLLYIFVLLMLLHTVISGKQFTFEDAGVFTLAIFYVGIGFHYLVEARMAGLDTLFYVLLIVWITDSGAYMIGRKFGKHKLAPKLSPNKTWEGSIGGTVVAVLVAAVYTYFFPQHYNWGIMLVMSIVLSVAGQFGDLIESGLKRYYKVKDSGTILPGHGGILDRFDSLLIVLPVFFLLGGLR